VEVSDPVHTPLMNMQNPELKRPCCTWKKKVSLITTNWGIDGDVHLNTPESGSPRLLTFPLQFRIRRSH